MHADLTDRQERFVFEYLQDQNASAAAARAGYTAKNMAQQGSELMNNPAIRDRVRMAMQDLLAQLRASAVELMKQRMRAAFFDAGKMLDGWEPKPLDEIDEETRAVLEVSTVMRKSGPVVRVKQPDRHRALRALEKVHEKLEQLNQRYYAQLERQGKVRTLAEIEALDPEVPNSAPEIAQKPRVPQGDFLRGIFSGCEGEAAPTVPRISEKHQVLSGSDSAGPAERSRFGKAWARLKARNRAREAAEGVSGVPQRDPHVTPAQAMAA